MSKLKALALSTLLCTSVAHAGLLIEPVLGYNLGSKFDDESDYIQESSGKTGPAFGGRLGYQHLGFQLGLDYLNSHIDVGQDEVGDHFKTSEFAGFVGFEFPLFLRLYAGYVFSATSNEVSIEDPDDAVDDKLTFVGGSGPKFGVGFTGLPFIDVNFEVRSVSYDIEVEDGPTGDKDELDDTMKNTVYMMSLSLPINI